MNTVKMDAALRDVMQRPRFRAGDRVTWYSDHYAENVFLSGQPRKTLGDGPFTIVIVEDAPCDPEYAGRGTIAPNWLGMGHTQYVTIDIPPSRYGPRFSGAFFKLVERPGEFELGPRQRKFDGSLY